MKRIYSNYTLQEFDLIEAEANKHKMSISAYCKYKVMQGLVHKENDITDLLVMMKKNLEDKKELDTFIISELIPAEVWKLLSRSDKNILAKQLAKIIRENPEKYKLNQVLPGKINQYIIK